MRTARKKRPRGDNKRIFLVDDHPMTRYGVAQLIENEEGLEVCGETDDARRALAAVRSLKPDLIIADLTMPGRNGLELIKDFKAQHPTLPVLVLSMHDEKIYAERALQAGAQGYLMKSAGGDKLLQAIRRILKGQKVISDAVAARIVDAFTGQRPTDEASTLRILTEREFQVFELLGMGMSVREIGERLHISGKTVETHRLHIADKLKLKNTSELTKFSIVWMRDRPIH